MWRTEPGSVCAAKKQHKDKKQKAQTDAQEVLPENEEELYRVADPALEHITHRDCGDSITGGAQELSGHNPVPVL